MKTNLRFANSTKTETLSLICLDGKTGINLRVSHKVGENKANTGLRQQFTDAKTAQAAVDALTKTILSRGWTVIQRASRNAFTDIPVAK